MGLYRQHLAMEPVKDKHTGIYYCRPYCVDGFCRDHVGGGVQHKYSLRTTNLRDAQTQLRTLEEKWENQRRSVREGKPLPEQIIATPVEAKPSLTLGRFATLYLQANDGVKASATLVQEESVLGLLSKSVGADCVLTTITPEVADIYQKARQKAVLPVTWNSNLRALKAIFQWAVLKGHISANPWRTTAKLKEKQSTRKKLFSLGELEKAIVSATDPFWNTVIRFLHITWCRRRDLIDLEWQHVKFDENYLTFVDTKEEEPRNLALDSPHLPGLLELLQELRAKQPGIGTGRVFTLKGRSLSKYTVTRLVKRFSGINPHAFRHSGITHALNAGVPFPVVQAIAGHSAIETTMEYYHATLDAQRQVSRQVLVVNK